MKKRYTDEPIFSFLKEAEGGVALKELGQRHGFSEGSLHVWRNNFGDMYFSDVNRLRDFETEYARLKKLQAESLL